MLLIYSSLSTCDPGDVHETVEKLKRQKVRASVVGLGAEMVSEMRLVRPGLEGLVRIASDRYGLL